MKNKILLSLEIPTDEIKALYKEKTGKTPTKEEMALLINCITDNEHPCSVKNLPSNILEYIGAMIVLNDVFYGRPKA